MWDKLTKFLPILYNIQMYVATRLQMWDKFWITKFSITKCLMRATYQVLLPGS
eukprot:COSAG02_NODE_1211_length_13860_cov_3.931618_3_plen_53_part_00